MSRIEVPMPQMGESITEGTVSVWLKSVGDRVERDEPIMEISTDKVDAEIPSPAAGTLVEILVQEGETVEVGTAVALIETEVPSEAPEGTVPAAPASAGSSSETETGTAEEGIAAAVEQQGAAAELGATAITAEGAAAAAMTGASANASADAVMETGAAGASAAGPGGAAELPAAALTDAKPQSLEERIRKRSSPLVRRMAEQHGIDLQRVRGTGWMGRVTKDDILAWIRNGGAAAAEKRGEGKLDWDEFYSRVEHPTVEVGPDDRVEPMSRMTRLIADHMVISKRVSPHVHSFIEVDYSRIDQVRAAQRKRWEEQGLKVSYTAFVARAVATALREHPKLNASISGTEVVYRGRVNLGIAVALPWGLIVPVVKQADQLSLVGIAQRINDLAERARAKKLSPEEVQEGTFTITNPGVFGTVIGFPIINQPQVAILCMGGIDKRPVVITDEFGNDAIVARKRGFISLGFDHRLVNGADGDSFLARVKELLESATEV